MNKEYLLLIIAPIVCFMWFNYLDKRREKKEREQLSNRLHVKNNVTQLTNVKYKRRFK